MEWKELGNIHLLITDDDEFNRQLIITLISKIPTIHCFEAGNGIEALDILEKNSIDILLLDLHMPKMDGYETLNKIKNIPNYKDIEIVIITTDEEEKKKLLQMGANDFLPKPFDLKELESRIYKHIESRKYRQKYHNNGQIKEDINSSLKSEKEIFTIAEIEGSQRESLLKMATMLYQKDNILDKYQRIALLSKAFSIMVGHDIKISENLYHSTLIMNIGRYLINIKEENQESYKESIIAGYRLLNSFIETDFIRLSKRIMVQHQEHFNGTGYPQELRDREIHILAYIVSIIEAFEILSLKQSYKGTVCSNRDEVYSFLKEKSGSYFHPKVTALFLKNFDYFSNLREKSIKKKQKRSTTKR